MTEDSVVALHHPGVMADPLTAVLRAGARELLAQAIEAEVAAVLAAHEHLKTEDGRRRLVRHGHGPERAILTGLVLCLCGARGPGPWQPEESASVSRHAILPRFAPRWMRFCRRSTFVACQRGLPRRWRRCSARTPLAFGAGDRPPEGGVGGRARAWRRRDGDATSTGPMASISRVGWRTRSNAFWSHRRHAGGTPRNSWASRRGCARAPRAGVSCWHACAGAGSRLVPRLAIGDGALGFRRWRSLSRHPPPAR